MEERLQKILSAAGVCSRRGAEPLLEAGRVTVNGRPAALGDKADPQRDEICVDGTPIHKGAERVYVLLHKPPGYVTTLSDNWGRPTVAQLVADLPARVWPVGRLDQDSEGLLLMTDDGALTQRLTHPSHEVDKEYHVTVQGDVTAGLAILSGPLELDGTPLRPAQVRQVGWEGKRPILSVVIHEGRNRQVRRMCDLAGLTVLRLVRVREGSLLLGDLAPGAWRRLSGEDLKGLQGRDPKNAGKG